MPNWCSNRLVITGLTEPQQDKIAKALLEEELLETFIPTPDGVDAYDHHCEEWGTKWDVGGSEIYSENGELQSYFESAWSPPVQGLTAISSLFPDAEFRLEYNEPGMAYCGVARFTNGECDDSYIDYAAIPGVSDLDFDTDDVSEQLETLVDEWISDQ
jgi:hypothetical protein